MGDSDRFPGSLVTLCLVVVGLFLSPKSADCNVTQRKNVTWSEYPFIASVERDTNNFTKTQNCTGALITKDIVVTSAYCAFDQIMDGDCNKIVVHHLVFWDNGTAPYFVSREANVSSIGGYEELNRNLVFLRMKTLDPRIYGRAKPITMELNEFDSRMVKLISAGANNLLEANVSIVALEPMKMYYRSPVYSVVFDDEKPLNKTDYSSIIVDSESNNLLAIVIDANPVLFSKYIYKAIYFYPEFKPIIANLTGASYVQSSTNQTDTSIVLNPKLNVEKISTFSYTLSEVKWSDHRYIAQVCNNRTKQICSATLVNNNMMVTTPECFIKRGKNEKLVVQHLVKNIDDLKVVTRDVTKTYLRKHHSCGNAIGPVHNDYIFMDLSPLPSEDEYKFELRSPRPTGQQQDKEFRYVQLVSLVSSPSCNLTHDGPQPRLLQLQTIATLNPEYYDLAYDCHIFNSTLKNLSGAYQPKLSSSISTDDPHYRVRAHNGIHNFDRLDYSRLFNNSATLSDFKTKELLGIGFVEPCLSPDSNCRTEAKRTINVVKAAKYEPNINCALDDGLRVNVSVMDYTKYGDNNFVALVTLKTEQNKYYGVHCTGTLVARNKVITSVFCMNDHLKNLNASLVKVSHAVYLRNIRLYFDRIVYDITTVEPHGQIAILHLTDLRNGHLYDIVTARIEFNSLIPKKIVKLVSFGKELYDEGLEKYYMNMTEVNTGTVQMIKYSQLMNSQLLEYAIPLNGVDSSEYDCGAPILDPITENVLGVISRYEPYSQEPVCIATYFNPVMNESFATQLNGSGYAYAFQSASNESHFFDESLSTKTFDVVKPVNFTFAISEVLWKDHLYIGQICNSKTRKICTATLIESNMAVTALHCLPSNKYPLSDVVFTHYAKHRSSLDWTLITRNVSNSRIKRHENCTRGKPPIGYTYVDLSPLEDEPDWMFVTRANNIYHNDSQFRYAQLFSVPSPITRVNGWSCNTNFGENPKLVQWDTLVSLNYVHVNQVYDCPIFNLTALNLANVTSSMLNSTVYINDLVKGFRETKKVDKSLLITDGSVLIDYDSRQLLGISYNESCDDYEDICMARTIRPVDFIKVIRLAETLIPPASDVAWYQKPISIICFVFGPIVIIAIIAIVHYTRKYIKRKENQKRLKDKKDEEDNPESIQLLENKVDQTPKEIEVASGSGVTKNTANTDLSQPTVPPTKDHHHEIDIFHEKEEVRMRRHAKPEADHEASDSQSETGSQDSNKKKD